MFVIYLFTFTKINIIMFVFVKVRVVQGVSDREYNAIATLKKTPFQEVKLHKKFINTSTKLIMMISQ